MPMSDVRPYLRRYWTIAVLGCVLFVTWLVEREALTGPFLFDDIPNLQNLALANGAHTWNDVARYVFAFNGILHRAISALSFLADAQNWPADPHPFKRTNLFLHLCCGAIVFGFSRCLALSNRKFESKASTIALLASSAWLLHPMQLSTTMLVVQRMTILMTLFTLIGLWTYVAAVRNSQWSSRIRGSMIVVGLWICGALAVASKENGALICLYALAIDTTLTAERVKELPKTLLRLRQLTIWLPITIIVLAALISWETTLQSYGIRPFSLRERLLTESRIGFDYLAQILLPRLAGMGIFHDDYRLSHDLLNPSSTLLCILLWGILLATSIATRKRAPILAFALFWFMAGHLMESTVVPLELYFEHRNYLPMIGPIFAIACLASINTVPLQRATSALFVLWICACAFISFVSSRYWGNQGLLATVWVAEHPTSVRANQFLSDWYYSQGRTSDALLTLEKATENIGPDVGLLVNIVFLKCENNTLQSSELDALKTQLAHGPISWAAGNGLRQLATEAASRQCAASLDAATWRSLIQAALSNPAYQSSPQALGQLHYEYGNAENEFGNTDNALIELEHSYEANPDFDTLRSKAYILYRAKRISEALATLDRIDSSAIAWPQRLFVHERTIDDELRKIILSSSNSVDIDSTHVR